MIDTSLHIPIHHQNYFEEENEKYLNVLNKEVDRLISLNDDCWGRLDTKEDTWSSYPINKDILFNNDIFDALSVKLKDTILQYAMALRADTLRHQVHLMDSSIYVCRSNPKSDFTTDDSQHFIGYLFLKANKVEGNVIIKNPFAFPNRFHHTGESPLREYLIKPVTSGDLLIVPSHIEHKMADFEDGDLRYVRFNITVA